MRNVTCIEGLGAGGEEGVAKAIDIIRTELDVSMALTGIKRVNEIGRHILVQQDFCDGVSRRVSDGWSVVHIRSGPHRDTPQRLRSVLTGHRAL
jgi:hypothetical protein